jgi:hypothetical protein
MAQAAATAKVLNFVEDCLLPRLSSWIEQLIRGELGQVEQAVTTAVGRLGDVILSQILPLAAQECVDKHRGTGQNQVERPLSIRLRSGFQLSVPSLYRKRPTEPEQQQGRHLMARHWAIIGGASPQRYDALSYSAVSLPSYDLAKCLLDRHGVQACVSGVRDLTNKVAERVYQREVELLLSPGESLAGKRVIISSDGGRTLTRQANGKLSEQGNACFDAKWREPKLFVIDVIDKDGKQDRQHLPLYGCRFSDDDHVALLKEYLSQLSIDQATEVQLIADGAVWIWNRLPKMLNELGVKEDAITQTLDYYHAVQHLEALFKTLPKRIRLRQRQRWWKRCKEWLWQGDSRGIVRLFTLLYRRFPAPMRTELNYFNKHEHRMHYADYERDNLLCGSGIVESSVRRVINLRYKNTSTFWDVNTVEKLYCLRGAVLSKRWDIMLKNLAK